MKRNNNKINNRKGNTRIPENDRSKAMNSKREVEQSNDAKTDQDFPGYPHYPAREDMMDERSGAHKVDMDIENMASAHNATGVSQRFITVQESQRHSMPPDQQQEDTGEGTEADFKDDGLAVLNSGKDEIGTPQNVSNEDLNANTDLSQNTSGNDESKERGQ